jgi:hypothetical protein
LIIHTREKIPGIILSLLVRLLHILWGEILLQRMVNQVKPTIVLQTLDNNFTSCIEVMERVNRELGARGWTVIKVLPERKGDSLLWPYWQVQIVLGLAGKNNSDSKPRLKFFYSPRATTESLALVATLVKHLRDYYFDYSLASTLEYFWRLAYRKLLNATTIPTVLIELNAPEIAAEIVDTLANWLITSLLAHFEQTAEKNNGNLAVQQYYIKNGGPKPDPVITTSAPLSSESATEQNDNVLAKSVPDEVPPESLPSTDVTATTASVSGNEQLIICPPPDSNKEQMEEDNQKTSKKQAAITTDKEPQPALPHSIKTSGAGAIRTKNKRNKQRYYPANPFFAPAGEPVYPFVRRYQGNYTALAHPLNTRSETSGSLSTTCSTFAKSLPASQELTATLPATFMAIKDLAAAVAIPAKNTPGPE